MYLTQKNTFSKAEQFKKPVVTKPILKEEFMRLIRVGVEDIYSRTSHVRSAHRMYANMLGYYLDKYDIQEIVPNEAFFNHIWDQLMEDGFLNGREYSLGNRMKIARTARKIVNEYFYPKGLVQRKVLDKKVIQRYEKFFALSDNSQKAIVWFENNGKQVKAIPVVVQNSDGSVNNEKVRMIHQIKNKRLLPVSITGKIEHAMRFLRIIGKKGFEEVVPEDVKKLEDYCIERNITQKEDYLAHVATFFINLHSEGFVKSNPFSTVSLKMNGGALKRDFIAPADIEKLKDISKLDRNNRIEVRDRMMILMAYDLALRINELLSLKVSDIKKDPDGEWYVVLKSDIQKGQDKDEEIMYFFFDETRELLEFYLNKTRDQFAPITDDLILANRGTALSQQHCRKQMKNIFKNLNIRTFYNKEPSPHVLRHSFATINIEPIGLSLPLYEMTQRLRHSRVETTRKHYIHNNPYLRKMKHSHLRKKGIKRTSNEILSDVPLADLEHWLSDKLNLDSATIKNVRSNFKIADKKSTGNQESLKVGDFVSEEEAVQTLKHLNIPVRSLRNYAHTEGLLSKNFRGTIRRGYNFEYEKGFIQDLSKNWISVQDLQNKLKVPERTLQHMAKNNRWRIKKIGRMRFIHRQDCI